MKSLKINSILTLFLCALFACSQAKELLTKEWSEYEKKAIELMKPFDSQFSELEKNIKSISKEKLSHPLLAPLKEKADSALEKFSTDLQNSSTAFKTGKELLTKVLENGKIEDAQKAFSDLKMKVDGTLKIASKSYENAKKEIEDLNLRIDHRELLMSEFARKGGRVNFNTIDFKAGKAEFNTKNVDSEKTLNDLLTFAKTCPELQFEITGHTSYEGKSLANQKLSLLRAEAVKKYLIKKGVSKKVIAKTIGKGSESLLVSEPEPKSEAEKSMDKVELEGIRAKNRRIEINVLNTCAATPAEVPASMPANSAPEEENKPTH